MPDEFIEDVDNNEFFSEKDAGGEYFDPAHAPDFFEEETFPPTGTTGATGTTGGGAIGTTGAEGADGTTGVNGLDGSNGTTGLQGLNGNDGANGTTGAVGTTGAAGAPGTTGAVGTTGDSWLNQEKYNSLINNLSTGIRCGGILSINTLDNTKFDISSGSGQVVDNSDCNNPVVRQVSWSSKTGLIDNYRLTDIETYIAIDENGTVIQEIEWFDNEDKRDYIILGTLGHPTLGIIEYVIPEVVLALDTNLQFDCFLEALGAFNIEGNEYNANGANLKLDKSYGRTFDNGANYANSIVHPSIVTTNQESEISLIYNYTLATNDWTSEEVTVVDPEHYDTLNGLDDIPVLTPWTIQTIYQYAPLNCNEIQYGQVCYATLEDAEAEINKLISIAPLLEFNTFRGWLIVMKGATDLSNPAQAKFIPVGKFGSVMGGGGGAVAGQTIASNVGIGGVGLYLQKSGVELQFKNIIAASNKITVTNDPVNRNVMIDVNPDNLPVGPTGATGTTGADSTIPGPTGDIGPTGETGTTGAEGAVGTTGAQGTTGADLTSIVTINAQIGTTYQLVLTDVGKIITLTNASPIAVTIPTNAVVEFLIGSRIDFIQKGVGKVTFSGAGVTINSKGSNKSIGAQNVGVSLIKEDTDAWYLIGDLIA